MDERKHEQKLFNTRSRKNRSNEYGGAPEREVEEYTRQKCVYQKEAGVRPDAGLVDTKISCRRMEAKRKRFKVVPKTSFC